MTIRNLISFVSILTVLSTCKKDNKFCLGNELITNHNHLVDISPLKDFPRIMDTLNKHPNLQVFRLNNDEIATIIHCHVYYKELEIFTEDYLIAQGKRFPVFTESGQSSYDTIPISLVPTLTHLEAIKIAKNTVKFNEVCTYYSLGIFDVNAGTGISTKKFKLSWQIQGTNAEPTIILDANTGEVYQK